MCAKLQPALFHGQEVFTARDGAYTLEIEPRFADVAIKRWQAFSAKDAICAETGLSFGETATTRAMVPAAGPAPTDVR